MKKITDILLVTKPLPIQVFATSDSLIRKIEEKEDSIMVTFKARPNSSVRVNIKKDTIVDWYEQYAGGVVPPTPTPEDLGSFLFCVGLMSDPHYNSQGDLTEFSDDIENAMEYFFSRQGLKFVISSGDMCVEKNKDLVMFTRLWANKAKVLNGGSWPSGGKTGFQLIKSGVLPADKLRLLSCLGNHDVRQVYGQTSQGFNDPRTANKWGSMARLLMQDGTTVSWEDQVTSDNDYGVSAAPDWTNDYGNPTNRDYGIETLREYIGNNDDDIYFLGFDDVYEPTAGWGTYNRLLALSGGWNVRGGRSKTNFYIKLKSDGTHAMPYESGGQYVDDTDYNSIFIHLSADYGADPNTNECWRFDHPYGLLDTSNQYFQQVENYVLNNESLLGNQNLYNRADEGGFNYQFYDCRALLWLESVLRVNTNKKVVIVHHHPFPQKAGCGKSVGGTGYYGSKNQIRPYYNSGSEKNDSGHGSYQLCGVQFHFLNILNRKYKNTVWITGHTHFIFEDDQYDPYLNFCNKEFDFLKPTAADCAVNYNGSTNVPAFYGRLSDTPVSQNRTGMNVHLPSLSRPKTLANGSEQTLPERSEGAVLEFYEHGIRIRPIVFKNAAGSTYVNQYYGDGQIITDEEMFG